GEVEEIDPGAAAPGSEGGSVADLNGDPADRMAAASEPLEHLQVDGQLRTERPGRKPVAGHGPPAAGEREQAEVALPAGRWLLHPQHPSVRGERGLRLAGPPAKRDLER